MPHTPHNHHDPAPLDTTGDPNQTASPTNPRHSTQSHLIQPHLTQRELANRWNKAEATLERYRSEGVGPRFLKIGGAVRYRLEDIEAFENQCLYESSSSRCAAQGVPA